MKRKKSSFKILQGIMDRQVLQRNNKNVCDILISGESSSADAIRLRVVKDKQEIKNSGGKTVAHIQKGKFSFRLRGIPVGGPYDITFDLAETKESIHIKDVMVGDVWILGGQSNMEGIALLKNADTPDKMVRAFYMDDRWAIAKEPVHRLCDAIDEVHLDLEGGTPCDRGKYIGTGPGISFGKKMYELTGVPQGLICCAHGGTSMEMWSPALKKKGGKSLYGAMLRRFIKNGSNLAGVLWYQGESDATINYSPLYTKRMKQFIRSVRRDFSNASLPFVIAQLSRYYTYQYLCPEEQDAICREGWNSVQWQQLGLSKKMEHLAVVPTVDLSLRDPIHLDGKSQQRLGKRFADAMFALKKGKKADKEQIYLKTIKTARCNPPVMNSLDIEISFSNIKGHLKAQGKPAGFALVDSEGRIYDAILNIDIIGEKLLLKTSLPAGKFCDMYLYYGYGMNPYCNITDAEDISLPVFGPCKLPWNK